MAAKRTAARTCMAPYAAHIYTHAYAYSLNVYYIHMYRIAYPTKSHPAHNRVAAVLRAPAVPSVRAHITSIKGIELIIPLQHHYATRDQIMSVTGGPPLLISMRERERKRVVRAPGPQQQQQHHAATTFCFVLCRGRCSGGEMLEPSVCMCSEELRRVDRLKSMLYCVWRRGVAGPQAQGDRAF